VSAAELRKRIRDVPGFPKPGIVFRDISPLLRDAASLRLACRLLADPFRGQRVDLVIGIESRGFIFGPPVALELGAGFEMARKLGKLPGQTYSERYELEYGSAQIEIHRDAVAPDQRVLVIDDVIATGGTAGAVARLVRRVGAQVIGASFLIELRALGGRAALAGVPISSVLEY
jgi:adenine phosphoribosyltransferase